MNFVSLDSVWDESPKSLNTTKDKQITYPAQHNTQIQQQSQQSQQRQLQQQQHSQQLQQRQLQQHHQLQHHQLQQQQQSNPTNKMDINQLLLLLKTEREKNNTYEEYLSTLRFEDKKNNEFYMKTLTIGVLVLLILILMYVRNISLKIKP
jgi:hypothetical protein